MKKKLLSALLALCMVLTMLPISAFALENDADVALAQEDDADIVLAQELQDDEKDDGGDEQPNQGLDPLTPEERAMSAAKPEGESEEEAEEVAGTEDDIFYGIALQEAQNTPEIGGNGLKRYSVLLLDTTTSRRLYPNGPNSYFITVGASLSKVKTAAKKFVKQVTEAPGDNYVAVISYNSSVTLISDFSQDFTALEADIEQMPGSSSSWIDSTGALEMAEELLDGIAGEDTVKNVLYFAGGLPSEGSYSLSGHYNNSDYAWIRLDNNRKLYGYCNPAYDAAAKLKGKFNLYTLGCFTNLSDQKTTYDFTVRFINDINNKGFFDATTPEDLDFVFSDVAHDILGDDSDGDGLYDDWELYGVDTDGDGKRDLMLNEMGADPNVPDIFVEVDWMVRPEKYFLSWKTQDEVSFAPTANAMKMVYEVFKDHGINIHIDAGPSSVDFVTGKTWGSLSGGNVLPYEEDFNVNGGWFAQAYEHWNNVAAKNFTQSRKSTFRYAMFINSYNGGTSTGLANDIPGQYFLVASNKIGIKNYSGLTDFKTASTFMHELGHTLGLGHGGVDAQGNAEHTHYKPNYLSIMNYYFQLSGLYGNLLKHKMNYAEYTLPALDENAINENDGVDPAGVTGGSGLGTQFQYGTVPVISKQPIDFNNDQTINVTPLQIDINADSLYSNLIANRDWDHITYMGGGIGERKNVVNIAGVQAPDEEEGPVEELTIDEAMEKHLLSSAPEGMLTVIGPAMLASNHKNQSVYLRISNLFNENTDFMLQIDAGQLTTASTQTVSVVGTDNPSDGIQYQDIRIPVAAAIAGEYTIHAKLYADGVLTDEIDIPVTLKSATQEELEALRDFEDTELPDVVVEELRAIPDTEYAEVLPIIPSGGTGNGGASHVVRPSGTVQKSDVGKEYRIEIADSNGGTVSSSKDTAAKGDSVTLTISPDEGYVLETLLVTGTNGVKVMLSERSTDKYSFTMPASDVTVEVDFTEEVPASNTSINALAALPGNTQLRLPFVDVLRSEWYYDAVQYIYNSGMMTGTSSTLFSPDMTTTRGMIVTILHRMEGKPQAVAASFLDVHVGEYYTDAVAWASANNIISGYSNGDFGPNDIITREQLASILYRYAQYKGYDASRSTALDGFADVSEAGKYALPALQWAAAENLITGTSATTLSPTGNATRAQAASILMRFCNGVVR